MKSPNLNLRSQMILISIISILVISTASCANNQTTTSQVETTPTPIKTENSTVNELPKFIESQVLLDAKKRSSKPETDFKITQSQKQNWGDSCLGLAEPGRLCAQVIVPGWKVVVSDGKNELVYRTDEKGRQVKLEENEY